MYAHRALIDITWYSIESTQHRPWNSTKLIGCMIIASLQNDRALNLMKVVNSIEEEFCFYIFNLNWICFEAGRDCVHDGSQQCSTTRWEETFKAKPCNMYYCWINSSGCQRTSAAITRWQLSITESTFPFSYLSALLCTYHTIGHSLHTCKN